MYGAAETNEDLCMFSFELKQIGLNRIMDWYTQIKSDLTITEEWYFDHGFARSILDLLV
jgi:hypothetical protein